MISDYKYVFHPKVDKVVAVLAACGVAGALFLQRHDETISISYPELHEIRQAFQAVKGESCSVSLTKSQKMEFFEKNRTLAECFDAARLMVTFSPDKKVSFTLKTARNAHASGDCWIKKDRANCEVDVPAYGEQKGEMTYQISLTPITPHEPN